MIDANGRGSRQLTAMQLEAQRRGWLLWPTKDVRTCRAHCVTARSANDPCDQCWREATQWQLEQRAVGADTARCTTLESSERQVAKMDRAKTAKEHRESERSKRETIAKRAAGVRVGQAAAKRRGCKPKSAKRTERLWV